MREGEIAAHAAMKYLVPVGRPPPLAGARPNAVAATRLCASMAPLKPTTRLMLGRQIGAASVSLLALAQGDRTCRTTGLVNAPLSPAEPISGPWN